MLGGMGSWTWVIAGIVLVAALLVVLNRPKGPASTAARPGRTAPPPSAAAAEAGARLRERFASARRAAFDPVTTAEDPASPVSKFGGHPWLPKGDAWPACPGCAEPMAFFVQLDVASLPAQAGVKGEGLIQLFMCKGESSKDLCLETWQHGSKSAVVRLIDKGAPGGNRTPDGATQVWPARRITDWKPLEDFPHYDDLELAGFEITEKVDADWEAAENEDAAPMPNQGDKLGGWPYWVQSPEYGTCRECGKRMQLVLQIDSEDNVPYMFGDAGIGHVCQCPAHPHVLTWGWACY